MQQIPRASSGVSYIGRLFREMKAIYEQRGLGEGCDISADGHSQYLLLARSPHHGQLGTLHLCYSAAQHLFSHLYCQRSLIS